MIIMMMMPNKRIMALPACNSKIKMNKERGNHPRQVGPDFSI